MTQMRITLCAHNFRSATIGIGNFLNMIFLVVGIIASIRKILTVEAHLSVEEQITGELFTRSMIDLGVNTGIVFILVFSFYLLAKAPGPSECAGCLGVEKVTRKIEELLSDKK